MKPALVFGPPISDELGQGAQTIAGFLDEVCARYGPREAVVMRARGKRSSWTYDELHTRSVAVAKALVARGLGKDGRVGILMANRPEYLASVFGIAMAGGVAVALSTFSTREELRHQILASAISILLFDARVASQNFSAMLKEFDHGPFLDHLIEFDSVTGDTDPDSGFEPSLEFVCSGSDVPLEHISARKASTGPGDIGGIFFSSGTTSTPKGIVHRQRAFAIQWWRWPRVFAMREPVRSWTGNGLFWSGNISMMVGTALATGGTAILQPLFDAAAALTAIEEERVTFLSGRPHQWARVEAEPGWDTADLSSLRYVTKGDIISRHRSVSTDWETPPAFGTTETMTICTAFEAETGADVSPSSAGAVLPGNVLKIVEPLSGAVVPLGQRGELCVKGPTLMAGYLGKPPEDCFDTEGFYHTGDGGWLDEGGAFYWEGRLTALIKTGGANVSPDEVDNAVVTFRGIKRSQTVGLADDLLGERVATCIVPLDGEMVDIEALGLHLRAKLAAFKCPRNILVFDDADFEITGNEKPKVDVIRRKASERLARHD